MPKSAWLSEELHGYILDHSGPVDSLLVELAAPLLVFLPYATARLRVGVVMTMWVFHLLAIGGMMNLGLFEYVMAVAWLHVQLDAAEYMSLPPLSSCPHSSRLSDRRAHAA